MRDVVADLVDGVLDREVDDRAVGHRGDEGVERRGDVRRAGVVDRPRDLVGARRHRQRPRPRAAGRAGRDAALEGEHPGGELRQPRHRGPGEPVGGGGIGDEDVARRPHAEPRHGIRAGADDQVALGVDDGELHAARVVGVPVGRLDERGIGAVGLGAGERVLDPGHVRLPPA